MTIPYQHWSPEETRSYWQIRKPLQSAQRMYDDVLAQHRAAMASDGARAVSKILKTAQSRANLQSCG